MGLGVVPEGLLRIPLVCTYVIYFKTVSLDYYIHPQRWTLKEEEIEV
jgi:hypothetical protein